MTIPTVLVLLVLTISLPVNWYVAVKLWRLSLFSPQIKVLRERSIVALALALIVTIFLVIFINNEFEVPPLDVNTTRIITRAAVLALSVPAFYWLWLYRKQ